MTKALFADNLYRTLFFLIGIAYVILYMPYGFEGTDTGYIFGSSWNIYNGQYPHTDFIYTRPAIPAYLHTGFLFLSETYGYVLERIFFFVQIFTYCYLGARLVYQHFDREDSNEMYFLATLGAIISVHNYCPMGWNTVDGIFYSMIGIYLILKKNSNTAALFVGALFMVLGTFSKQSFYFLPIFLGLYLILEKNWTTLIRYGIFGLFWVGAYVGFKWGSGSLEPFIEQTFIRTPASGLVESGIKEYYLAAKFQWPVLAIFALAIWAARKWNLLRPFMLVIHAAAIGYITYFFIQHHGDWLKIPFLFQLALIGSGAYFIWMYRSDRRFGLLILLLTISWSAGISNGYRTPIHFSLPFVFASYWFVKDQMGNWRKWAFPVLLIGYLGCFYIGYQTLYRDSPRNQLTYSLSEVYPQLAFIKSDKESYDRLVELKELSATYNNFTVLPAFTQAHYLTGTVNPIGTDWPLDVEINDEAAQLEGQLRAKSVTVLMEKRPMTPEQRAGYTIMDLIEQGWQKVDETEHFIIYQLP